ncbi:MAG: hypothetical protein Q8P49_01755 [Candidatus Liptonbacteria bacterium]|nr:hypothetical protein [Candidatus Liptonbacteria bacterium]
MDDDQEKPEPQLHAPIIILGFVTFAIFDLVGLIPFISSILDAGFVVVVVVLALSGIGGTLALGVNFLAAVAEFFPVLQAFPFYTAAWAVTVLADRNQKVKTIVTATVAAEGLSGGKISGTGGAAGAEEGQVLGRAAMEGTKEAEQIQAANAAAEQEAREGMEKMRLKKPEGGRPSEMSTERKPGMERPAEAREGGMAGKPEISKEALGEQPTPFEEMEKTFREAPAETPKPSMREEGPEPQSRIAKTDKDIQEKLDRYGIQEKESAPGKTQDEDDEDLPMAA